MSEKIKKTIKLKKIKGKAKKQSKAKKQAKTKKHNKSNRKYKKKGSGPSCSRQSQNENTSPENVEFEPVLTDAYRIPTAEISNDNVSIPLTNAYSKERLYTVKDIISIFNFDTLDEPIKSELENALLNYEYHRDFIPKYDKNPSVVEDRFVPFNEFNKKVSQFERGQLSILVSDWHDTYGNDLDKIPLLIEVLKSHREEEIGFY